MKYPWMRNGIFVYTQVNIRVYLKNWASNVEFSVPSIEKILLVRHKKTHYKNS